MKKFSYDDVVITADKSERVFSITVEGSGILTFRAIAKRDDMIKTFTIEASFKKDKANGVTVFQSAVELGDAFDALAWIEGGDDNLDFRVSGDGVEWEAFVDKHI